MAGNLHLDRDSQNKVGKRMRNKIVLFSVAALMPVMLLVGMVSVAASSMSMVAAVNSAVAQTEEDTSCQKDDDEEETGSSSTVTTATVTNTVQSFADKYGEMAYQTGKKYGLPYEAILGQAAVESAWGKSTLTTEHHNFFGIKATGNQKSVTMRTSECTKNGSCYSTSSAFASWDSDQEGFDGYGQFIRNNERYKEALNHRTDPKGYIEALKAADYASATNYVSTVWGVTEQFIQYIRSSKKWPESNAMEFDIAPPEGDSSSSSNNDDEDDDENTACKTDDDENSGSSTTYGEIGGAPTDTQNFGWLCETSVKVCKSGDFGRPMIDWPGSTYQCYWYWLARSYVVFDGKIKNPFTEEGGQLYAEIKSVQSGWETSTDPKPGAGVSFGNGQNHVAFVEKVEQDPSGWKIMISEGNVRGGGSGPWEGYGTRWMTKSEFFGLQGGSGFFWRTEWNL